MLNRDVEKKLNEIDKLIKKSSNPYFLFDDDPDGLSSFLLIYKKYKKGKFSVVRGKPRIDQSFIQIAMRNFADLIVILDKPEMNEEIMNSHLPVVWIDHHPLINANNIIYFNPLKYNLQPWPTTYWVYEMIKKWPWIASVGIVGDWYILDVVRETAKMPEFAWLFDNEIDVEKLFFESTLGRIIKIFGFILRGDSRSVKRDILKLANIDDPREILINFERALKIEKEYNKILRKALNKEYDKCVVFFYESKYSFTGLLANELLHHYSNADFIIVGRKRRFDYSLSLRSKSIRVDLALQEALKGIRGSGGGHNFACGATINIHDIDRFIENLCNVAKSFRVE